MFPSLHYFVQLPTRAKPPEHVARRVMKRAHQEILECWGSLDCFKWERDWTRLDAEYFDVLTLAEQVQLVHSAVTCSALDRHLSEIPPTRLIDRVRSCLWQYGCCSSDWKLLRRTYIKLMTFDFGEPDFTTAIDYPWTWMGRGTGELYDRWIDGGLAYVLHYKGKPVAILGFSMSSKGLLIQQAQACNKTGNRWMYRLPGRLLDVMVDKLQRHFKCPIWIVDGVSQGQYLREVHTRETKFPQEEEARIAAMYDAPIRGFRRTKNSIMMAHRKYHRLVRNLG